MFGFVLTATILFGAAGGVAMSFLGTTRHARRVVYALTFGPVAAVGLITIVLSVGVTNFMALSVVGAFLCVAYLFFWFGKTLAKPFAEIQKEREERNLSEEFK